MNKNKKREYDKLYRLLNKEKRKESEKRYRTKHKKELLKKNKIYRLKNKEKEKIRHKKYKIINNDKIKIYNKKYREINKEKRLKYNKWWKNKNKEKVKLKDNERARKYYLNNRNKIKKRTKEYRNNHRKERQRNNKKRLKIDPLFKLNYIISRSVSKSLKNINCKKLDRWNNLLGYNNIDLKDHLEKQFTTEMNWQNYGTYWHIDHIIPLSWFKTEEQLIKNGWKLKNLQPLEAKLNLEKRDSFIGHVKTGIDIIYL